MIKIKQKTYEKKYYMLGQYQKYIIQTFEK